MSTWCILKWQSSATKPFQSHKLRERKNHGEAVTFTKLPSSLIYNQDRHKNLACQWRCLRATPKEVPRIVVPDFDTKGAQGGYKNRVSTSRNSLQCSKSECPVRASLLFATKWTPADATSNSSEFGSFSFSSDCAIRESLHTFRRPWHTQRALEWIRWLVASAPVHCRTKQIAVKARSLSR